MVNRETPKGNATGDGPPVAKDIRLAESPRSESTVSLSDDETEQLVPIDANSPANGPLVVTLTDLESTESGTDSMATDTDDDALSDDAGEKTGTEMDEETFEQHLSVLKCRHKAELKKVEDEIATAENYYFGTRRTRMGSILKGYGEFASSNMETIRNKNFCRPVKLNERAFSLSSRTSRIYREYDEECKNEALRKEAQFAAGYGYYQQGMDAQGMDYSCNGVTPCMGMDFYAPTCQADIYGYNMNGGGAMPGHPGEGNPFGQQGFASYMYPPPQHNPQVYLNYGTRPSIPLQTPQMMGPSMRIASGSQPFLMENGDAMMGPREFVSPNATSLKRPAGEDENVGGDNNFNVEQFLNMGPSHKTGGDKNSKATRPKGLKSLPAVKIHSEPVPAAADATVETPAAKPDEEEDATPTAILTAPTAEDEQLTDVVSTEIENDCQPIPKEVPLHSENSFLLPPKNPADPRHLTVVLDLDETLVRSCEADDVPMQLEFAASVGLLQRLEIVCEDSNGGPAEKIMSFLRPGVYQFLNQLSQFAEVVIFTAGDPEYASPLVACLDPEKRNVAMSLFRDATVKTFFHAHVKDLSRLGRDPRYTVLVDNNPFSFLFQPDNGVLCEPFYGDPTDQHLSQVLMPLLKILACVHDVRPILRRRYNLAGWCNSLPWQQVAALQQQATH